ncbi:hypothetical protein [Metabacillus bambusae]|uniref:Flagellar hook-length control protein-like C-terminal domain-containing protein n=1 Tax=Metabacillus bambusae TaxID=2795218 RepID=A0ABS3MX55_9BACI|nr:hypothetical protein [Metabacillus bambusae]MBO1510429.1 hypothetical protein [Metabacillus bambusae]
MERASVIGNLLQQAVSQLTQPQRQLTLKENQVVLGHVLKLFPDQKALIQVGHSKLVAHLDTPIHALEKYWFTVKGSDQLGIKLKIVKQVEGDKNSQLAPVKDLLSLFQQQHTKNNLLLANELIRLNIPITKQQLITANEIIKNTPKAEIPETINTIVSALKKYYPLSEVVVRSIIESQRSEPLAQQIDKLLQTLQQENVQTKPIKLLTELIQGLMQVSNGNIDNDFQLVSKDIVLNILLATEKNLGLMDETKLWHQLNSDREKMNETLSFKNMLISASKEVAIPGLKEQIDQLIHRLNGQSLLYQDNGPTQQIMTQIPLFMHNQQTDLTIQWNGKKQADGTIDPAFCRIIFYLQLPRLNETMIDVQIQNRVMNIIIRNNSKALGKLVTLYSNELKEHLSNMDYHVTSVKVKPFEKKAEFQGNSIKQVNIQTPLSSYTGVDIKI